jgi:hypothetical protein
MQKLDVLIMVEGGYYVAQGLEIDVCAQGRTLDELIERFVGTLYSQILLYKMDGMEEEQYLSAPQKYFDRFEKAQPITLPGTNNHTLKLPQIYLRMET